MNSLLYFDTPTYRAKKPTPTQKPRAMPWAVSCCPFGASLGANLLNAALLFTRPKAFTRRRLYTPKALHAPQVLYTAEGLYPQLCCFTRRRL